MAERLNDTKIAALKRKARRYEVRDGIVRGLYVEVGSKGGKVWWLQAARGGKRERIRLGPFPDIKTADARNQALLVKDEIARPRSSGDVRTVAELFERYKMAREDQRRAWRDVESVWDNWARDRIGHVLVSDVNHHHGLDLRDYVSSKSSASRAAKVLIYLRPMFAWAAKERLIDTNPWVGISTGLAPQTRDRVLSANEWREVWQASFEEPGPFGPFTRVLMLSGQRLSNVAQMRWDEIEDGVWTIPREKFKATRPDKAKAHEVPLSRALTQEIRRIPRTSDFVFNARSHKAIQPGSRQKNRLAERAGVSNWTYHDLRRTAATRMAEGGISRFIIERALGHADQGVTATYDRATYRDEKRNAFEVLAASLPSNEVNLQPAGRVN